MERKRLLKDKQAMETEMLESKINKRGIISDYLPWLLIAVAILAILMIAIFVLKGKGVSLVDSIKNLFGG